LIQNKNAAVFPALTSVNARRGQSHDTLAGAVGASSVLCGIGLISSGHEETMAFVPGEDEADVADRASPLFVIRVNVCEDYRLQ
jgi:hypothetical protein